GLYVHPDYFIESLPKSLDTNPVYFTPLDDPLVVCDAIFNERPSPKRLTKKGEMIVRDPFQMELTEMKLGFRKWETILSNNLICLLGSKDHSKLLKGDLVAKGLMAITLKCVR
nr:hypothetical protein [Tanacetum cinerariifolium]